MKLPWRTKYLMNNWQPIETAPKDGSEILLLIPLTWGVGSPEDSRIGTGTIVGSYFWWKEKLVWRNRTANFLNYETPTHWQPLPEMPNE